jgi:hypothetical protein
MNLMPKQVAGCLRDKRVQGSVENVPTRGGQWLERQLAEARNAPRPITQLKGKCPLRWGNARKAMPLQNLVYTTRVNPQQCSSLMLIQALIINEISDM